MVRVHEVAGSNPVFPIIRDGALAQLGERLPRTQEVVGSNPIGSIIELEEYPSPAEGVGFENR